MLLLSVFCTFIALTYGIIDSPFSKHNDRRKSSKKLSTSSLMNTEKELKHELRSKGLDMKPRSLLNGKGKPTGLPVDSLGNKPNPALTKSSKKRKRQSKGVAKGNKTSLKHKSEALSSTEPVAETKSEAKDSRNGKATPSADHTNKTSPGIASSSVSSSLAAVVVAVVIFNAVF